MYIGYLTTPIGLLEITGDEIGICRAEFVETMKSEAANPWVIQAKRELQEYFEHRRKEFSVPLHIVDGTAFQRKCWEALRHIPYGETWSYYDEACYIRQPKAVRAVGGANHHNPIVIIIPCHRVIAKNGSLCGYGGGVPRKQYLLEWEAEEEE